MTEYALVDADGVVVNKIVADAEFAAALAKQVEDPEVDTGDLQFAKIVDVTGKGVDIGDQRSSNGKFSTPQPPPAEPEDPAVRQAAEAEAAQRVADDSFLTSIAAKLRSGKSLTQDERDRKDVIVAQRS